METKYRILEKDYEEEGTETSEATAKKKEAEESHNFKALWLGRIIINLIALFVIVIIATSVRSCSSYKSQAEAVAMTATPDSGARIPVKINGKDTLVTVGEFFPVSYGAEKPKKPSFKFNSKKYGHTFQRGGGIDSTLWKENGDGTKVSADKPLPISWGNDEIYTWSKTGKSGTTWFIMTKRE
jgi:hypothetical protein